MNKNSLIITTSLSLRQTISACLGDDFKVFSIHEWLPLFLNRMKGQLSKSQFEKNIVQNRVWHDILVEIENGNIPTFILPPGLLENAAAHLFIEMNNLARFRKTCLTLITRKTIRACLKKRAIEGKLWNEKYQLLSQVDQLFHLAQKQYLPRSKKLSIAAARALDYLYANLMTKTVAAQINFNLMADLCDDSTNDYTAFLVNINSQAAELPDKNYIKAVVIDLKPRQFTVLERNKKTRSLAAPLPMNTERLVRHAEARYGYTPDETLQVAQSLYEGLSFGLKFPEGLITFPWSNSFDVPGEDVTAAREFILNHIGVDYLPKEPAVNSQPDSIGAIRPTQIRKMPKQLAKYLSVDQLCIYTLVWEYFIASQMIPAKLQKQQIHIAAGSDDRYLFQIDQERVMSRGFLQLSANFYRESTTWAKWRKGTQLALKELRFSLPRHKENQLSLANLVAVLAAQQFPPKVCLHAVDELLEKKMCTFHDDSGIELTASGAKYRNLLKSGLDVVLQDGFVKRMELNFENMSKGKKQAVDILPDYEKLFTQLQQSTVARPLNKKCPECGGAIIAEKDSRHCENFPYSCHYFYKKSDDFSPIRRCKECGSEMIEKNGPYGRFLACSAFPKCRHSEPFTLDVQCPESGCSGMIVERRTKNGATFYGCSRYPECRFSSWQQPVNTACPACGSLYLLLQPGDMDYLKCPACKKHFNIDLSPKNG